MHGAVIMLMAKNVCLHQVWGLLDLGHLLLILLEQHASVWGVRETCVWGESQGRGGGILQKDGSSGIPSPAGEQKAIW